MLTGVLPVRAALNRQIWTSCTIFVAYYQPSSIPLSVPVALAVCVSLALCRAGLAALGTDDDEVYEDLKSVLYTDSAGKRCLW